MTKNYAEMKYSNHFLLTSYKHNLKRLYIQRIFHTEKEEKFSDVRIFTFLPFLAFHKQYIRQYRNL